MDNNYLKQRDNIVRKYGFREGVTDTLTYIVGGAGFIYSLAETFLEMPSLISGKYDGPEIALGVVTGGLSYAIGTGINKINEKRKQKSLKNLEKIAK